jgi:hypothetical protein
MNAELEKWMQDNAEFRQCDLTGNRHLMIEADKCRALFDGRVLVPVETLDVALIWLKSALDCKSWHWDHDQHQWATMVHDELRAMLAASQEQGK